jgi:hypothetical protein
MAITTFTQELFDAFMMMINKHYFTGILLLQIPGCAAALPV